MPKDELTASSQCWTPCLFSGTPPLTLVLCQIFFLSGVAALLFETLWFYQAGLVLGNTVWASSLVLASFMAGLALGNALIGHISPRIRRPVRLYVLLELAIGLTGAALVFILPHLSPALTPLLRQLEGTPWALNGVRFAAAFVLLLIPSTAMGATLPMLAEALFRQDRNFGRVLGRLYGWNTLGAVVGALVGEVIWLELFGVLGTALAAAALNGLAALAASRLVAGRVDGLPAAAPRAALPVQSPRALGLLVAAAGCGGILLALEVVWFRLLALFVTGSGLAFALMLAVVLAGIGLGGLSAARWLSRRPEAWQGLPALACLAGVAVAASFFGLDALAAGSQGVTVMRVVKILRGAVVLMAAVSLISGALFTLLGAALNREVGDAGGTAGLLTFANTVGAALGSLVAAFVLLPQLGADASMRLLAAGYGGIALILWAAGLRGRAKTLSVCALALMVAIIVFPSGFLHRRYLASRFRYWDPVEFGTPVVVHEGLMETIVLLRQERFGEPSTYRLLTNSISMSSTYVGARRYMELFTYLPAALHPGIRSALLISYGIGNTAGAMTRLPGLETIDVVDPSRDILESNYAMYADPNDCPLSDPRVRVHLEDGRHFLQTTTRTFDLITGEPPPPKHARIVSLYTREYFALMRDRLAEGGLATYWLPAHTLTVPDARAVVRAFCEVFEDCSLWNGSGLDWVLMGSRGGLGPVPPERIERLWAHPAIGPDLITAGIERPEQLGALFMGDAEDLRRMTRGVPPLTDNYPKRISNEQLPRRESVELFEPWRNVASTKERFERSAFIARVWPEPLRRDTLAYFPAQGAANRWLVQGFHTASDVLPALHRVLTQSSLSTMALWLAGSSDDNQRPALIARAKQLHSADLEFHLGAGAMARRDYAQADAHYHAAIAGGSPMRGLVHLRLYALCMQGKLAEAQTLASSEGVARGQTPDDQDAWWFFSNTFQLKE